MSILGDMFFESTAVTADLLVAEPGVGAGVALRVRVSSAPKNIRGITPGEYRGPITVCCSTVLYMYWCFICVCKSMVAEHVS